MPAGMKESRGSLPELTSQRWKEKGIRAKNPSPLGTVLNEVKRMRWIVLNAIYKVWI